MLQGHAKRAKTEHLSNVGPSLLMRSTTCRLFHDFQYRQGGHKRKKVLGAPSAPVRTNNFECTPFLVPASKQPKDTSDQYGQNFRQVPKEHNSLMD